MQRCQYCGQLNDDITDECIYCGEPLYIEVEHDDALSQDELSRQYAAKIAQELLEDERRKQKRKQPNLFDDLDDFAKELLKPEDKIVYDKEDENIFLGEDESQFRQSTRVDEPRYVDEEDVYYDVDTDDDIYAEDRVIDEPRHIFFEDEDEDIIVDHENENTHENLDDDFYPHTKDIPEDEDVFDEDDKDFIDESIEDAEDSGITPEQEEQLKKIEEILKHRIKRNRKLEESVGINIENITLIVETNHGPINILGNVRLRKPTDKSAVKITFKCYDKNKKQIFSKSTTLLIRNLKDFNEFNVSLPLNNQTAIIIIVPELIDVKIDKSQVTKDDIVKKQKQEEEIKKEKPKKSTLKDKIIPQRKKQDPETEGRLENNIFLEQIKDIERKIGMNIDNTSILIKSDEKLEIVGEIHIKNPEKCRDIKIATTCYDKNNKIIATGSMRINTKLFLGFDTLHVVIDDIKVSDIKRIRLYPTFQ